MSYLLKKTGSGVNVNEVLTQELLKPASKNTQKKETLCYT